MKTSVIRNTFKIGVLGSTHSNFRRNEAVLLVELAIGKAISHCACGRDVEIVTKLTNHGIPAVASMVAWANNYRLSGVVGSETRFAFDNLLDNVDFLVRVGGSDHARGLVAEFEKRGGNVLSYELGAVPLPLNIPPKQLYPRESSRT